MISAPPRHSAVRSGSPVQWSLENLLTHRQDRLIEIKIKEMLAPMTPAFPHTCGHERAWLKG